ncbi:arylsulfatase, partial [bacterium]|nr:arylsulfatase [bacterium]
MRQLMFVSLVLVALPGWASDRPARPNIIFILADDLGYADLGCYGQKRITTPRLDQLAREGTRFTDCYAGSTVCAPSRCVLMTGLHTGHATIRGNSSIPLGPNDVTVARMLNQAGYRTGAVGKWGLGVQGTQGVPNKQGFDRWYGFLDQTLAHNYYPEFLWRNEERFRVEGNVAPAGVASQKGVYVQDLFVKQALSMIDEWKEDPFFLYVAFTSPHANNEAAAATGNGMEVPDLGAYANEPWPAPERGRAAMISRLDADIGKLLDKLNALGLTDRTIIFFSSDNGPHSEGASAETFFASAGPLRGKKRDLYEGGIRVPGIVRWPGHVPAGRVSDYPWGFWDFAATATDLTGASPPATTDGRSIVPTLLGQPQPPPAPFYWEFHERGFDQAARDGNWKGVRRGTPDSPIELYDLGSDISETKDVSADHPDVVARLDAFLKQARSPDDRWPIRPVSLIDRLRRM